MKTEEDEAFDELARKQGAWGGGFKAKQAMAADKLHWSDCAVHNGPAYPAGECDCGATEPWNEDEWRRNNWRCHHGWLRGEQCEICNAAQEPYDQTALELCGVCGWKTLIPDDGCLNCERAQPAQEHVAVVEFEPVIQGHEVWFPARCIASEIPTGTKLYTKPPKREWVGLTDEEIREIHSASRGQDVGVATGLIEAKLKEKNNGL